MPAYVVFIRDRITDQAEMDLYAPAARAAQAGHAMRRLAFYGPCETPEGPAADGVVLLEFADMEAARAWYDSPAYQAAKQHRLRGAEYRVVFTEGV